jgi:hypothetical protein
MTDKHDQLFKFDEQKVPKVKKKISCFLLFAAYALRTLRALRHAPYKEAC